MGSQEPSKSSGPGVPRARRFDLRRRRKGRLTGRQSRALTGLAIIYGLRMMGLYMVLPVLSIFALSLSGASPLLVGFALGAYGLTQALFQIPLGHLSDRYGRKTVISVGLGLFAAGSLLASFGTHIILLIAGRILQGSGAVASAVVALAADLSPSHARTQAMARLGIWVGIALAVGIASGPAIASALGVPVLFLATAVLSAGAIVYLQLAVPEPVRPSRMRRNGAPQPVSAGLMEQVEGVSTDGESTIRAGNLREVLSQPALFLLCAGIFLLHATLTALFVIMPVRLTAFVGQGTLSLILAPAIGIGLVLMLLSARVADRHERRRTTFLLGAVLLVVSCAVLTAFPDLFLGLVLGLGAFIMSLSLLEPLLPALVSQRAPAHHRGTAIGVFHMSQFLGSFAGGPVGGVFLTGEISHLFLVLGIIALLWTILLHNSRSSVFLRTDTAR
ncbi:MAG: MFS transporter [Candidatus Eisenbacteria bacterium]|nr:MFS transporter [Candidatus Eisenbacteria bacterium]